MKHRRGRENIFTVFTVETGPERKPAPSQTKRQRDSDFFIAICRTAVRNITSGVEATSGYRKASCNYGNAWATRPIFIVQQYVTVLIGDK